jgi:putative intracellular protease/amidase
MQDLWVDADAGRVLTAQLGSGRPLAIADKTQWLLEDELKHEVGIEFSRGPVWQPYIVTDRNLLTGQNPQSAEALAERLLKELV